MTVDLAELAANLARFYNFSDKIVLCVGAGGGQLLAPDVRAKRVIAIDQDPQALRSFLTNFAMSCALDSVSVIASPFDKVELSADVVYFEFCLHEMPNPYEALVHGRSLAPDVVVFDHMPGSDWCYYAAEDGRVFRSNTAIRRMGSRRRLAFETEQRFATYEELEAKLGPRGAAAIRRVRRDFEGSTNIAIPMRYQLALL